MRRREIHEWFFQHFYFFWILFVFIYIFVYRNFLIYVSRNLFTQQKLSCVHWPIKLRSVSVYILGLTNQSNLNFPSAKLCKLCLEIIKMMSKTLKNVRPRIAIWIDFTKIKKLFRCLPIFWFMSKLKKERKTWVTNCLRSCQRQNGRVRNKVDVKDGCKTRRQNKKSEINSLILGKLPTIKC